MPTSLQRRPAITAGEAVSHMVTLAIIAATLGVSFFFEIGNYREGPIAKARGIVTRISMDAAQAYALPRETVMVKLAHGPTVSARAPRGLPIRRGDIVIVDIYRYHLTGIRSYRIHHLPVRAAPTGRTAPGTP